MKVFVDECVNRRWLSRLAGHTFVHAGQTRLRGMKNGALLRAISPDYDVFLTRDRNIPFQQNLKLFALAFVVLRARSNALPDLMPLAPGLIATLKQIEAGSYKPGDLYEVKAK